MLQYMSVNCGLGLGVGILATSFLSKTIFLPSSIYAQASGLKHQLMAPDIDDISAAIKRYSMQGNREAAKIEQNKLRNLRKSHGIYAGLSMFNIFQLPMHMVWVGLINRMAFNYDKNPEILTEGFFWFKDLSSPDPFGILPIIGGLISFINILMASTNNMNATMRKMRRFIYLFPFISIPIWMTFPAVGFFYFLRLSIFTGLLTLVSSSASWSLCETRSSEGSVECHNTFLAQN